MSGRKYDSHVSRSIKAEKEIIELYKKEILNSEGNICLHDYINEIFPDRSIEIKGNSNDSNYKFLDSFINKINKFMAAQQACYELMCEAKLMPLQSKSYLPSSIEVKYIINMNGSTLTIESDINLSVLAYSTFMRVN